MEFPPGFQFLWVRAEVLTEMGRLDEARATLDRAVSVALQTGSPDAIVVGELWKVPLAFRTGSPDATLACAARAFDQATAFGTPLFSTWAHIFLGLAHLLNEDWDAAAKMESEALRVVRERRAHFSFAAWAHAWLAEAQLGRGDHRAAREEADNAIALARRCHARACEMDGLLALARVLLRADGPAPVAEIEATLARASALVEETGARCRIAPIQELRAELAGTRGDRVGQDRNLREAHRLFTEVGATGHARRLESLLQ